MDHQSGGEGPDGEAERERSCGLERLVRSRDWMYLGPIAAAPMVHILATLYKSARPQTRRMLGYGIGASFALTLYMRLWMMNHAGGALPGDAAPGLAKRLVVVKNEEEKRMVESPSAAEVVKQVVRGMG